MREQTKMDAFEEILCDAVRRYPHLYNPSLQSYKDAQMTSNSWGEIARCLGKEEKVCRAKWKYLRDRFVKIKKKAKGRSGASGGKMLPAIYHQLSWLTQFVKHRETDSNFPLEVMYVLLKLCNDDHKP